MPKSQLDWLYNRPHYYYEVRTLHETIFGSVDKKRVEKVYEEFDRDEYVELVRFKNGNIDEILKSK